MKSWTILSAFIFLAFVSCRKEPASWNTDWNLVVIQDTLNLNNLVTNEILGENPDGSYRLLINRDILNLNMNDLVPIPNVIIDQGFSIPAFTSVPAGLQFIDQVENNLFDFEGLELKKIHISSGKAKIKVSSPISTLCIVTLNLPKVTKDGVDFSIETNVPAGTISDPSSLELEVDLSGYQIDLRGINTEAYNLIQSQFRVKTDPNGATVNIGPTHVVRFEVEFSDLKVNYAQGYFGNRLFTEQQELNLDFMNRIVSGAIDLDNVNLKLTLFNGIKVGARARINQLEGENQSGNIVNFTHPQVGPWIWINETQGTWNDLQPSTHEIVMTSQNSNIESFLENLPKWIRLNFGFEINPFGNTSGGWDELFSTSFVRAFLTADMPLALGMNNLTLRDTFNLNLGETGAITPKSGSIKVKTFNAYSFGASLQMQVLDSTNAVLLTKSGNGSILGSNVLANFAPVQVVPSEVVFEFNETEMEALLKMNRIVLTAVFNSPNSGQIAQVHANQYLAFKIFSNLKLNARF